MANFHALDRAPRRGAIYVRLSEYGDEYKTGDQESICRKVATRNGVEVVVPALVDDGIGSHKIKKRRDNSEEMLRLVERGHFDVVVAQNQERFFRNPTDYAWFMVACEVHRVLWLTESEGWTDLTTADGKMQATIRFAFALGESARQSERQLQRNEERRFRGDPPSGPETFV